jgi:hypothetical protein
MSTLKVSDYFKMIPLNWVKISRTLVETKADGFIKLLTQGKQYKDRAKWTQEDDHNFMAILFETLLVL